MSMPYRNAGNAVLAVLCSYVSRMTAQSIYRAALQRARVPEDVVERDGLVESVINELRKGLGVFLDDATKRGECIARLEALGVRRTASGTFAAAHAVLSQPPTSSPPEDASRRPDAAGPCEIQIVDENGVVDARTRAKVFAASLGFGSTDQCKLATVVSELSRNIFRYAGRGKIQFGALSTPRPGMFIVAIDNGPGIRNLDEVLSEAYVSRTGLGRGLQGCRKIMDEFRIETALGRGTVVSLKKYGP